MTATRPAAADPPRAPEDVWATTTRKLRDFVARRVPASDVDDITQDILFRILRTGRVAEEATAPAWLYTVARNAVIDHYRTRKPLAQLPAEFDMPPGEEADEPPAALQEAALCLRPAIATLDAAYRDAITMVDLEGMTQVAAARVAGLSVPGMKSRVQRGRRMLAERMREWCSVYLDDTGRIAKEPCACRCEPTCATP